MVQMNWFSGQKLRHRCREQTYGHTKWGKVVLLRGGWWDILGDWFDIYILICIKWITSKNLLYKKINKIKLNKKKK